MNYDKSMVVQLHLMYNVPFSKIEEESQLLQGIFRNWIGDVAIKIWSKMSMRWKFLGNRGNIVVK